MGLGASVRARGFVIREDRGARSDAPLPYQLQPAHLRLFVHQEQFQTGGELCGRPNERLLESLPGSQSVQKPLITAQGRYLKTFQETGLLLK